MKKATIIVGSAIHKVDVIEHEGRQWMVPHWVDSPDGKWTRPLRIIPLDAVPHQPYGPDEFVVNDPLPEFLFYDHPVHGETGYEAQEMPEILLPHPSATN